MGGIYIFGFLLCVISLSVADVYPTCNTEIICNANTVTNHFKRHPTDCAKSYKCKNSAIKMYTCPEGQHFSVDLQACATPTSPYCKVECFDMEEGTTEKAPETSAETPETLECVFSRCPETGSQTVYLPHEDCTKYCVCENHSIHTLECSAGLHFSPKLKVCDWPATAGCATSKLKVQHLPTVRI